VILVNILVQKFGGTSVSTIDNRKAVVSKIRHALENGYSPVVVVSAMGRNGEPYATDTLLSMLDYNFKSKNFLATDLLISCGEIISTVVMCNELKAQGIECIPLTGSQAGILTDNNYGNASVLDVKVDRIITHIKEGKVPVIAGFQGATKDGYVTTLGRGGSDVTAAIIGSALKSETVEIYTDVNGIMTADPKLVEDANLIKDISYNEVFQLADQGAKVIHPRAVQIAMKSNITLVIKNTMNSSEGTRIGNFDSYDENNIMAGITYMNKRVQIRVYFEENKSNVNYNSILDILYNNNISIDLINVLPEARIFTIDQRDFDLVNEVFTKQNIIYHFEKNCSKVSIVGSKMKGKPGIMARILNCLNDNKVDVLQTADSHMTIWCLIKSDKLEIAVKSLHKEFCTDMEL
jgi:aspartate kinase